MSDNLNREVKDFSSDEKRALLAQLLKEKANQSKKEYPLSYGQRALWFIHQLDPDSSAYLIGSTSRIISSVNATALRVAPPAAPSFMASTTPMT